MCLCHERHREAKNAKDGSARAQVSKIVNNFVRREGGKLVCSDAGPWFEELRSRVEKNFKKEKSEGDLKTSCRAVVAAVT